MRIPKFKCHVKEDNRIHEVDEIDFVHREVAVHIVKSQGAAMVSMRFRFTFDEVDLLQFTGLLDKNGTEIYEGDKMYYPYDHQGRDSKFSSDRWVVTWKYDKWTLQRGDREVGDRNCADDPEFIQWNEGEVIGTIFDPDQSKKEK